MDVFDGCGVKEMVEGVLGGGESGAAGRHGGEGRDGLLATLGVTGSGKVNNSINESPDMLSFVI